MTHDQIKQFTQALEDVKGDIYAFLLQGHPQLDNKLPSRCYRAGSTTCSG